MIVLDTHAFVWLASDPAQLSPSAARTVRENADKLYLSVVSAWEIALLAKRGRLTLPLAPSTFISRAIRHHRITELPLERRIVERAVGLPDIHNDPFDRILVAECLERGGAIISRDRILPRYPRLTVIW